MDEKIIGQERTLNCLLTVATADVILLFDFSLK